jgi:protein-L-isoaspartate(D-aspartate) O-methyltransferase
LENGSFEEILEGTESPRAWHYQRQLQLTTGDGAPDGERYAKFRNLEPSRGAQALQGLAIDGRAIQEIDLSCWVRVAGVGQGGDASPGGSLAISFYDQQRKTVGDHGLGPWRGTFDWRVLSVRIPVPIRAREAIVRIGLFGAVGELDLDAVELKVIRRRSTP